MIFGNYKQIYDFIDNLDTINEEEFEEISSGIAKLEKKYAKYKDFAFYHTPQSLVKELHRYLNLEDGDIVFDPTCGHGALLHGLKSKGADIKIKGIEITEELYNIANKILKKEYGEDKVSILKGDTLSFDWENGEDYNIIIANPPFGLKCKYYDEKEGKYKGFIEVPIFEKMLRAIEKGNIKQLITIFPSNFIEKYDKKLGITQRLNHAGYTLDIIGPFDEAFDNTKIRVSIFNIEKIEKSNFKPNLEIKQEGKKQVALQLVPSKFQKGKFLISIIEKIKNGEMLNKEEQRFLKELNIRNYRELDRNFEDIINTLGNENIVTPNKISNSDRYSLNKEPILKDEKNLKLIDIKNLVEIIKYRDKWFNISIPNIISKVIIKPETSIKELLGEVTYNILNKGNYKHREKEEWKKISLEKYYEKLSFEDKIEFFIELNKGNDIRTLAGVEIDIYNDIGIQIVEYIEKLEEYKIDKDLQLFIKNYKKILNGEDVTNKTFEKYVDLLNSKYLNIINEMFGINGEVNFIKLGNRTQYGYTYDGSSKSLGLKLKFQHDLIKKYIILGDGKENEDNINYKKAVEGLLNSFSSNINKLSRIKMSPYGYNSDLGLDFSTVTLLEVLKYIYGEEGEEKYNTFKTDLETKGRKTFIEDIFSLYEKIGFSREALLKYLMFFLTNMSLDFNNLELSQIEAIVDYLIKIKENKFLEIEKNAILFLNNLNISETEKNKLLTIIYYIIITKENNAGYLFDKNENILTLRIISIFLNIKDYDELVNILLKDIIKLDKIYNILENGYTFNTYNYNKISNIREFEKFIYNTLEKISKTLGLEIKWNEVLSLLLYLSNKYQRRPLDTLDKTEKKYRNFEKLYDLFKEEVLDKKEIQILTPQNFLHTLNIGYGLKEKEEEIDLDNYMEDNLEFLKKLLVYQKDGFLKALKGIEKYNGYIIADDVGLGKTYVGAAMVSYFLEQTDKKILIIAPKSVVEGGAWERVLQDIGISEKAIKERIVIKNNTSFMKGINEEDFGFVLVDEAHVFRNKDTQRGYNLAQFNKYTLIESDIEEKIEYTYKTPILMLTATPINNSMEDIYNLISYFYGEITLGGSVKFKIENEYFWKEFTKFINKYDRKKIVKNFGNIELKGAKIKDEYPEINYLETEDYETEEYREKFIDFINKSFKRGIDIDKINSLSFTQADIETAAVKNIFEVVNIDFDKFNLEDIFKEVEDNNKYIQKAKGWIRSESKSEMFGEYSYKTKNNSSVSFGILLSDLRLNTFGGNTKIRSYEKILEETKAEVEQKFFNIIKTKGFLTYLYIKKNIGIENIDELEIKNFVQRIDADLKELEKLFTKTFYENVKELFTKKLISIIFSYAHYSYDSYEKYINKEEAVKVTNEVINNNKDIILEQIKRDIDNQSEYVKGIYQAYIKIFEENNYIDISAFKDYEISTSYGSEKLTSQYLVSILSALPDFKISKTTGGFFGEIWSSSSYKDYSKAEIKEFISDYLNDKIKDIKKIASTLEKQINKFISEKKQEGIFSGFLGALVLKRMDSSLKAVYKTLKNIGEKGELITDEEEKAMLEVYSRGQRPLTKEQRSQILDIVKEFEDFFLKMEDPKHNLLKDLIEQEKDKQWLIFTSYTDTLKDIEEFLRKEFPDLNIETITGQESKKIKQDKIYRFSPEVNGYKMQAGDKKIDILISTDTLSEGVNLHDVYRGINYDLPYNPVRLQQRVGRLFRIGAKNTPIFYNFVPSSLMDEMLGLMNIIGKKEEIINSFFGIKKDNISKVETETLIKTKREEKKLDYNKLMEEERKSDIFLEDIPEEGEKNNNSIETIVTNKIKEIGEETIELKDFNILFIQKSEEEAPMNIKLIPFYYEQIVKEIKVEFLGEKEPKQFLGENYYGEFLPKTLDKINKDFIGIENEKDYFNTIEALIIKLQDYLKLEENGIKANFKKAYTKQYELLTMINNPISKKKFSNEGEKLKFLIIIEK